MQVVCGGKRRVGKGHAVNEQSIADELWPQLRQIAASNNFITVRRVDMTLGESFGVATEALVQCFDVVFQGSCFDGAAVNITIIHAGQEYLPPGRGDTAVASGWEMLITKLKGAK